MGVSLKEDFALLPDEAQEEILAELDPEIVRQMAMGYWWWESRPEQVPPAGEWTLHLYLAGRGAGKAISLDTSIPTPDGWKKMADIAIGDTVFDEQGKQCRVTGVYDRWAETAYRLTFSDGSYIDACDEHQWITWGYIDRKAYKLHGHPGIFQPDWASWKYRDRGPKVRTTQQIVDTFTAGSRNDTNHCIPVCFPLELPEAQLPIDPYVLGLWLGDGSSAAAELTCADPEIIDYIRHAGYSAKEISQSPGKAARYVIGGKDPVRDATTGRMVSNGSLHSILREQGLLGNKHVPTAYLRASVIQRQALLQGLMDSDGYADGTRNTVEFCSTNIALSRAVLELARSLGQKPVMAKGNATLNGRFISFKYRVTWRPTIDVFRLPRKRDRIKWDVSQRLRNRHRMISKFERIEAQQMRCITVDSPNSLFLAGEAMIPTHNTRSGAEWLVDRTEQYPLDSSGFPTERLVMAYSLSDARLVCIEGPSGIIRVLETRGYREVKDHYKGDLAKTFHYIKSPKPCLTLLETGAKIFFSGSEIDAARGLNLADVWADEIIKWGEPGQVWREGLRPALRADIPGDKPRAFVTTTPRPISILQDWLKQADLDRETNARQRISVVRGSTFDNKLNLSEDFLEDITKMYEGTALGRQELYGEMLEMLEGALFSYASIEDNRVKIGPDRVAHRTVGVDPGLTGAEDGDEMGVVVACRSHDDHIYVLADETTRLAGRDAALHAWRIFSLYEADTLVYESNLGKAWMHQVFTDAFRELQKAGVFPREIVNAPLVPVFSNQGKKLRAEPVAMRYSQGRVHHIGKFERLESQMVMFDPLSSKSSPDRLDALVHACRHLINGERRRSRILSPLSKKIDSLAHDLI